MDITYKDFLETAQTGDILLFNSRKFWYSRAIEACTHSKFSHIGIIVRNPSFLDKKLEDGLYLLESGYEGVPDSIESKLIYGVQLVPLEDCFRDYVNKTDGGYVYYRQIHCEKPITFYRNFSEACNKVYAKPYDVLPIDWLKAELGVEIGNVQRMNTFWCSALVTYMYIQLGLLPNTLPWTLITPHKYSYYEGKQLDFNCTLDAEKYIIF